MKEKLARLRALLAEISDLERANAVLAWDQQTFMPGAGAEARGRQMGTLSRIAHDRATSGELGKLLGELRISAGDLDPDSDDARLIQVAARDYDRATRVPSDYVEELARTTALAYQAWVEAKRRSDFALFRPHLEKIVALKHRYVGFFPPAADPYDVFLDEFEPGMTTAEVRAVFHELRPRQLALIRAIRDAPQVDDSFLRQAFDERKQREFGVQVISRFGYDWKRGRQDISPHPFSTGFSIDDVRITTRVDAGFLGEAIFSTMHECGHALYTMGHAPELERSPLAGGASYAVHESQSRLWENLVGRSLPFWRHFYPPLQKVFPQLATVALDRFYRAVNKVQPSSVRTEADEATYNLHVMLRLEIETALLSGTLAVDDLPEAWNAKMVEYLGVTPPDDARGVLQDVHWAAGHFGYFPSYALGNLISAQLWETMNRDIEDIDVQIGAGSFEQLRAWLQQKVHRHGRKFLPQELLRLVTGTGIDAAPYLRYIEAKYREIYRL